MSFAGLRKLQYCLKAGRNRLTNLFDLPVVVLLYHRVTRLENDPQQLAVTPENFRQQLRYLRAHWDILRFEEDWAGLTRPAVAITFDDGYADNVLEALPILEEEGVPATFFVSTGTIGTRREFWWDELERILLLDRERPINFELQDERCGGYWPTGSAEERRRLYGLLHPLLMGVGPSRREGWLQQLRNWAGLPDEGRKSHRPMTVEELERLGQSPLTTVGAHTVSHTPLSTLSDLDQRQEILESAHQVESWMGSQVKVFSYPFGRRADYDVSSVRWCREAGFVRVASNFPGQVHRWTDPFQVPRHLVRNWPEEVFRLQLSRFWYT